MAETKAFADSGRLLMVDQTWLSWHDSHPQVAWWRLKSYHPVSPVGLLLRRIDDALAKDDAAHATDLAERLPKP